MALTLPAADASELVYAPRNPSFGGNPSNGPVLMSVAQAQNSNKAPTLSPLERFNNSLQQAILSRLQADTLKTMFGSSSSTLQAGTYDTGNYTVTVVDQGGGNMTIVTYDKTTGATATFDISSLVQ